MSTPTNDGGPAFPTTQRSTLDIPQDGMALRDWFAGQALAGCLSNPVAEWKGNNYREMMLDSVSLCYQIADAMLAERAKGGSR